MRTVEKSGGTPSPASPLHYTPGRDVDPPRFFPPSNCYRRGLYRLAALGAISCFRLVSMEALQNENTNTVVVKFCCSRAIGLVSYCLPDIGGKLTAYCMAVWSTVSPAETNLVCIHWKLCPCIRTLRSTNASRLVVPPVKLSTVGSRAFAVAAPHIWNTLPTDVVAASSLSTFRRLLKRFLFKLQYPDIIYWHHPTGYDTRCYFNVRLKADMSQLNLPHGNNN